MKRSTAVALLYSCALLQQKPCGASDSSVVVAPKQMPPPPPPPRPPPLGSSGSTKQMINDNNNDKNPTTMPVMNNGSLPVRQSLVDTPPPPPHRAATSKEDDDDQRLLYTPPETRKKMPPPPPPPPPPPAIGRVKDDSMYPGQSRGERPPPPPPPPSSSSTTATRQPKLSHDGQPQDQNLLNDVATRAPKQEEEEKTRKDPPEKQSQNDDAKFEYSPTNRLDNDDNKSRTRIEFTAKPADIPPLGAPSKTESTDAKSSEDKMVTKEELSAEKKPTGGYHDETTRPNPHRQAFDSTTTSRVPPPPPPGSYQGLGPPLNGAERDNRASLVNPPQSGPPFQPPPPGGVPPTRQAPNQQQYSNRPPPPPPPPPFQQQQQQQQQYRFEGQRMPPPPQAATSRRPPPPPHNKVDPRLLYNQASARRKEAAPPPTWRRILRKIEGSLDGLANLEDTLGGKARQLYSSTVDTAAVTVARTSKVLKTQVGKPSSSSRPPPLARPQQMPGRPVDMRTSTTTPQQPSLADRVARKTDPQFAAKVSSASPEKRTTEAPPQQQQQPQSRAINWEDVMHKKTRKVIRANGGASHPTDTGFRPPNSADTTIHPMSGPPQSNPASQNPPIVMKQAFPPSDRPATPSYHPPRPASRPNPKSTTAASLGDDDDDSTSWKEKFSALIPSIPRFHFGRSHLRDYSSTVDAWKADEEAFKKQKKGILGLFSKRDDDTLPLYIEARRPKDQPSSAEKVPATLTCLGEKCSANRSFALLTEKDRNICNSLGRSRSIWDMATMLFFFLGVRCLPIYSGPVSPGQPVGQYAEAGVQFVTDIMKTWAPFALAAAILSSLSSQLLLEKQAKSLASQRRESIAEEVQYGRLFLRLFTSENTPRHTTKQVGAAVYEQVLAKVELSRMRNFGSLAILTIAIVAVRSVQPIFEAVGSASLQILELKEIRQWPPEWKLIWDTLKASAAPLVQMISATLQDILSSLKDNPLRLTYETSIVLSLFMASLIPSIELKRKLTPPKSEDDEDEAIAENYERFTNEVSALGTSSSTRLSLLSESVEGALERWRLAQPPEISDESAGLPMSSFVRMCAYGLLGTGLLLVPVMVYAHVGILPSTARNQIIQWDSLFDLAVVLYFFQSMVWKALKGTFRAKRAESLISGFMTSVRTAIEERSMQLDSPAMNLQLQASISPTAGLNVRDLWAAHATKRAWAVRGANLACRSGELLLILGDESAGKTRLLTTIAEAFLSPPRASRTVTRINRGSISLGGLDVSKWDSSSLRKRLGVVLNDVRASSDKAKILSGMTMEEILEPYDGLRTVDPSHAPSKTERACITQALHITGLNASLLPRLPSKMSTVVTANEEDLKPSPFRPHAVFLSPVEWSKVQLARVLSQAIFDNDSTSHNGDKFENCMVGSVLLLDDVSAGLSEIDEGRLLKNLRQIGAAVVVTSNRWAAGRWADKIVVVRDGVIVESGTHAELLTRGAQRSVYASNWHAMTSTV